MRGILKENDHVITSSLEHNAVWRCLKTLERDINIKIDTVESAVFSRAFYQQKEQETVQDKL